MVSLGRNGWERIKNDMLGGLTAAVVALPLALAFGIASGAGAVAGLYASIFGGFLASAFGGCGVQITGPTGAMTAVLVGVAGKYGLSGMFLAGAIAGLMQILMGLFRVGGFVRYLPRPVVAGFTNGVSVLFFMLAVDDALNTISITVITTAVILLSLRFFKKIPESLTGLAVGLIVNELFIHSSHVVGDFPFHMPKLVVSSMPFGDIGNLIMPALTICLLGSISSLLSAEVTDGMIGSRHDSNRELIGQGIGNLISSLVGGIPVAGAVARSGVNVHSGGRTKRSGMLHSVFLLLMVLIFSPIVKRIPLASLAAILMVASLRTADWKSLKLIPRARASYGVIMTVTTVLTVVKDLTVAVFVGVILSAVAAMTDLASMPYGKIFSGKRKGTKESLEHPQIQVIAFHGPLFFVGVENLKNRIREISEKQLLIFDFSDVPVIDETGALSLRDIIHKLQKEGKSIYIGGLHGKPLRMLLRMGVVDSIGDNRVYKRTESAFRKAIEELSGPERETSLLIPAEGVL